LGGHAGVSVWAGVEAERGEEHEYSVAWPARREAIGGRSVPCDDLVLHTEDQSDKRMSDGSVAHRGRHGRPRGAS
jgi:hypothetical protein